MDNRNPDDAILRDTRAEEIAASIDYDFARLDNPPTLTGTVLRTSLFDRWSRTSSPPIPPARSSGSGRARHTVRAPRQRPRALVRPGPARCDRPAPRLLHRPPSRTGITASVTDAAWADTVTSQADGPCFLAAEAVLPYLAETAVRQVLELLADRFPGSLLALDTAGPGIVTTQTGTMR